MKKIIVLSLGGSLIVPDKINFKLLEEFKRVILKNTISYKFIIVCGGGKTARVYIDGLENQNISNKEYLQSLLGVSTTRLNARFMTYFFGKDANKGIPHEMVEVENYLRKDKIVFCGALRYAKNQTSDATSAKLAHYFKCDFINLTDVSGLYDKNPKKFKNAKFIPEISYKGILNMFNNIKFKPGQHFVLDKTAIKIIKKYQIRTFILGPDFKNLDNLLNGKHFVGSIIDK